MLEVPCRRWCTFMQVGMQDPQQAPACWGLLGPAGAQEGIWSMAEGVAQCMCGRASFPPICIQEAMHGPHAVLLPCVTPSSSGTHAPAAPGCGRQSPMQVFGVWQSPPHLQLRDGVASEPDALISIQQGRVPQEALHRQGAEGQHVLGLDSWVRSWRIPSCPLAPECPSCHRWPCPP